MKHTYMRKSENTIWQRLTVHRIIKKLPDLLYRQYFYLKLYGKYHQKIISKNVYSNQFYPTLIFRF